jgi:hypothetical protein
MSKKEKKSNKHPNSDKKETPSSQNERTAMERLTELQALYGKLKSLGLSKEIGGVDTFVAKGREYVRSGTSDSGSVPLPGLKRRIDYVFSNRKRVVCTINLRYDEHV